MDEHTVLMEKSLEEKQLEVESVIREYEAKIVDRLQELQAQHDSEVGNSWPITLLTYQCLEVPMASRPTVVWAVLIYLVAEDVA